MTDNLGPRALITIGEAGQFIARVNAQLIAQQTGESNPLPLVDIQAGAKALEAIGEVSGIVAKLLQERDEAKSNYNRLHRRLLLMNHGVPEPEARAATQYQPPETD
jgi:hypothetical protein